MTYIALDSVPLTDVPHPLEDDPLMPPTDNTSAPDFSLAHAHAPTQDTYGLSTHKNDTPSIENPGNMQ